MNFGSVSEKPARTFFIWALTVFFIMLVIPASLHHSAGYEAMYDRSVASLNGSFTFGPDLYIAPGMPLILGFLSFFNEGDWQEYTRLLQFSLYLFLVILTYHAGRLLFGDSRAGFIAAAIMAVSPAVLLQIFSFGPDLLYAAALLIGVVFSLKIVRNEGRGTLNAAIAGAAFGYGAITDPIGLYAPLFVVAWLVILLVKNRTRILSILFLLVLFTGMFGAIVLPWYVRNTAVFGIHDAPIVQKNIEIEVFSGSRAAKLLTYPFFNSPFVVLTKSAQIFFTPPDLDFFDQNTSVSYRTVAIDLISRGVTPDRKVMTVLIFKSAVVVFHGTLMLLAVAGFFFAFRNIAALILPVLTGYVLVAVIGYGSLTLFQGISPLHEFLIPLYGLLYAFAGYALLCLWRPLRAPPGQNSFSFPLSRGRRSRSDSRRFGGMR